MHDTCSEENDTVRLVCKKSDTVTEPAATAPLDAELSLSASAQLPGDELMLPGPPTASLGDRYDIEMYDGRSGMVVVKRARTPCRRVVRGTRNGVVCSTGRHTETRFRRTNG